ncbi:hypothetical protein [Mycobacteroides abscessus]|uniref:hypothetical protein n=1 Tax=Mycobacteroides abscessus TaxID=36809 RepID=UPI003CEDE7A6
MSDPVIEAAQRAWIGRYGDLRRFDEFCDGDTDIAAFVIASAREMAKTVQEQLAVIRERYELVRTWNLAAKTSAEVSRHSSEMAGLKYAYDLIAPTVYPSEELGL